MTHLDQNMSVSMQNVGAVMAADLNVLGAAIKILLAGGSALSAAELRRASGASYYLWASKGDAILALVRALEPREA